MEAHLDYLPKRSKRIGEPTFSYADPIAVRCYNLLRRLRLRVADAMTKKKVVETEIVVTSTAPALQQASSSFVSQDQQAATTAWCVWCATATRAGKPVCTSPRSSAGTTSARTRRRERRRSRRRSRRTRSRMALGRCTHRSSHGPGLVRRSPLAHLARCAQQFLQRVAERCESRTSGGPQRTSICIFRCHGRG